MPNTQLATSGSTVEKTISKLPDEYPTFSAMVRQAALDRYVYITGAKTAVVSECRNWDDFCYGSQLAIIMIAGKDLKLFFKAHFFVKPALSTIASGKSKAALFDLFREYCNLTAGAIKQGLHAQGILSGISLPTVTSGYDEVIFSDTIRKDRMVDCFQIGTNEFSFVATIALDATGSEIRESLAKVVVATPDATADDVEFL